MVTRPENYEPFSVVRSVGARLIVDTADSLPRKHAVAEISNANCFTSDSDPAGLLDGNFTAVSAETTANEGEKTINLSFSNTYPPEFLKVCLDPQGSLPEKIYVSWSTDSYVAHQAAIPDEMGDGIFAFYKPADMEKPAGAAVEFIGEAGIMLRQLALSSDDGEGFTVTQRHICSLEINEQADVTARSFKPRKLAAEFIPTEGLYAVRDISGRKLKAEIEINGSYIAAGEYYIDSLTALDGGLKYRLEASDIVSKISRYPTGLYVNCPVTVRDLINYGSGAVGGLTFVADDYSLDACVFPGMLKDLDSQRDCILRMAQAARMSSVWTDRLGRVRLSCLHRRNGIDGELPPDGVTSLVSDSYGPVCLYVKVLGENQYGEVAAYSGSYKLGCYAQVLKNDFLTSAESYEVAGNFLKALNMRHRIVINTRCDPTIEIGDRITLYDRNGSIIDRKSVV